MTGDDASTRATACLDRLRARFEPLRGSKLDLAAALCKRMGATCTVVQQDRDSMIPALMWASSIRSWPA